jgi:8-oxo-dGTP diphosphatase
MKKKSRKSTMKSIIKKSKTATFGIIVKGAVFKGNQVLLLKRTDYKGCVAAGEWDIPGGRLEEAEDVESGLHREMLEEANIKGKILLPFATHCWYNKEEEMHKVALNFIVEYESGIAKNSHEHEFARWYDLNKIPEEATQWVKEVIKKASDVRDALKMQQSITTK